LPDARYWYLSFVVPVLNFSLSPCWQLTCVAD